MPSLHADLAHLDAQIEAHYDAPIRGELAPHKTAGKAACASYATRMARWNAQLDVLTTERRSIKNAIAEVEQRATRVFQQDIDNARSAECWRALQARQIAGLTGARGR